MKFILAVSAFVATAIATDGDTPSTANELMAEYIKTPKAYAKIVNRCSYDVNLWSVDKAIGCSPDAGMVLKSGQTYQENLRNSTDHVSGISIKLSKTNTCGGQDITQLEYMLSYKLGYEGNFLDMSFVDCLSGDKDCPGFKDGFYLKSGNTGTDVHIDSAVDNQHCPIFSVANAAEAAKVSYIDPNDVQTKWCELYANLELYLCGADAPDGSDSSAPSSSSAAPSSAASSSSKPTYTSQAKPTTSKAKPTTTQAAPEPSSSDVEIKAAAVTSAPAPVAEPTKAVKTVVEYVTAYVDAPVKRHAHGRRHQHFKA